ncbi:MAG: InlB B-repeat-containing protein [Solirubrobacterales bacterium]
MSEVSTANVPFGNDEGNLVSALISPDGQNVYFGSGIGPGSALRLATDPLTYSGDNLSGLASERVWFPAVRSPDGAYGYWGAFDSANPRIAQVVKVDLAAMSRVASVPLLGLPVGVITASGISPSGNYGYFATYDETQVVGSEQNKLVRLDLASMASPTTINLPVTDLRPTSVLVQPSGQFAYLGSDSGRIIKVNLQTMTRVDSIDLSSNGFFRSGVMSPDGRYGYFATRNDPAKVVKVDLDNMTQVGSAVSLGAANAASAAISPDGTYGYFGTETSPGKVVRVRLSSMTVDDTLTLGAGKDIAASVVVSPDGQFGYVGTFTFNPAKVVKVKLADKTSLTVSKSGSGTVSGSGIDCGNVCSISRLDYQDLAIQLQATPASGQVFTGWTGACTGTGTCQVTLDQNRSVGASFTAAPNPDPGPNPSLTTPSLALSALKAKVKKRALLVSSKAAVNGAGTIAQRATSPMGKKTKTWCKASKTVSSAGTLTLKCNLGKKGRTALRKKALKLTLRTTFTPATAAAVTSERKLTIKRRR